MAHPDSFGARSTLSVGGRDARDLPLDALQARYDVARLPYTLRILLENVLRREDGVTVTARDVEAVAAWDADGRAVAGDQLQPGARPPAGLHRRPGGRRPRRDARRDGRPRRRPAEDQPADPRRARDRPLRAGRRLRDALLDRAQLRARVQAQPRALRVPALGPGRLRELQGRAAEHRHLPPGQPRVPRARRRGARRAGVPGHGRRHRLAHDDDQRARRARLGRRRDRGRGGDARRGDLDARAAGRRLPAPRRAARGRDRDRPRAHGRRRSCARPASSGSSSSTSATALAGLPLADRATIGNMSPEYGATCGFFPVDDETLRYLRLTGRSEEQRRARRGVLQGERALARPRRAADVLAGRRARPLHRRAVDRRAAPAAGPDPAARGAQRLLGGAALVRCRRKATASVDEAGAGVDGRERRAGADRDRRAHRRSS